LAADDAPGAGDVHPPGTGALAASSTSATLSTVSSGQQLSAPVSNCQHRSATVGTGCRAVGIRSTIAHFVDCRRGSSMTRTLVHGVLASALLLAAGLAEAADLTVRVDAREITRRHVHTDMSLGVKPGPLTLVFPKWIPGEHGPTGPLETIIGMTIRAN